MNASLAIEFEPWFRVGVFVAIFVLVGLWEFARPRRQLRTARAIRWPNNIGLLLIDVAVLRLAAPGAAISTAVVAQTGGWGLFNVLQVPDWIALPAAVLLLDLAIYLQHVTFHAVPILWRLHRVHHADLDFDVTTGTRFHPVEILISTAIKCAAVAFIGAPVMAVLLFEVLLNATSMFNHANASLPGSLDRWVRLFVVTPDMHRVHHSIRKVEHTSNFGFNVPWWDRLFKTYRAQPEGGHDVMTIGLPVFRSAADSRLDRMLVQPLRALADPPPA